MSIVNMLPQAGGGGKSYYKRLTASGIGNGSEQAVMTFPIDGYCVLALQMVSGVSSGFWNVSARIDNTYLVRDADPEGSMAGQYVVLWNGNVTAGQKLYAKCYNEGSAGNWSYNAVAAFMPDAEEA